MLVRYMRLQQDQLSVRATPAEKCPWNRGNSVPILYCKPQRG
jgi:hypothetical protein